MEMNLHCLFGEPSLSQTYKDGKKKIDKLLVKEINKYSYKLESHASNKWNRLRKKELIKQYERTILHFLLTDKCPLRYRKMMTNLKTILESVSKNI